MIKSTHEGGPRYPGGLMSFGKAKAALLFFIFCQTCNLSIAGENAKGTSAFIKNLESIFSQLESSGAKLSFLARSLGTSKFFIEKAADAKLNPASNVKLMTSAAALYYLKPDFRFKTEYYALGEVKDGVLQGDLLIKGFGDPSISTERLRYVAHELASQGIRRIQGNLLYDDSYFDSILEAEGFKEETFSHKAYASPVGALSVNHNIVGIIVSPGACGKSARVEVDPPSDYFELAGNVRTVCRGRSTVGATTKQRPDATKIIASGNLRQKVSKRINRRIYHPSLYFTHTLKNLFSDTGIEFSGDIRPFTLTQKIDPIYVDWSPPLTEIVDELNKFSSNFIGEMLVKAMGAQVELPATFANGLRQMNRFLVDQVGLDDSTYVLGNGSGLNHTNRFSARQIVALLSYVQKNQEMASDFMDSLGVAGLEGTISKRMRKTPAERRLRAKTGTLSGVSALSGYVQTQDDDLLVFSILVEGARDGQMRRFEDRMGAWLAGVDLSELESASLPALKTAGIKLGLGGG